MLAGDYEGAEALLLQIKTDDPALASARRAQLYLAWYDSLSRSGGRTAQRHALLQQAMDAAPWNLPGLERLLELTQSPPDEVAWAAATLDKLDWTKASVEAHILVGMDAWRAGRQAAARQHMEAAFRANPHDIRASNNLAWILAHDDPPELERALQLSSEALSQAPGQPNVLDTRGRILFKLERWPEALRDFESLAPSRPQDKQLHELLAVCYARLGMSELAGFQRRLAANADGGKTPPQTTAKPDKQ